MPLSALTQEAIRTALRRRRNDTWIDRVRQRAARVDEPIDTAHLLEAVRKEFGR